MLWILLTTVLLLSTSFVSASRHHALSPPAKRDLNINLNIAGSGTANRYLLAHNVIRANHDAAPLTWNEELAAAAAERAAKCELTYSYGTLREEAYGELIAAATGSFQPEDAVTLFAQGSGEYKEGSETYNHWTQIVWKSTTTVGCAQARCTNMFDNVSDSRRDHIATFHVCLYDPAGNVAGQLSENVKV